jgi:hypothetical protein
MTAASHSLTRNAQSELDRYLRRVRAALRGHSSVDADEVERDIRGHIDAALAESPPPVSEIHLRAVLDQLGSPSQWVPPDELSVWRKALVRLRSGPEDWRLTYATFALLVAGPLFGWPIGGVLFVASVLVSRATLELLEGEGEPVGARRWLLYPPLLVVDVGLLATIFMAPPLLFATLADPTIRADAVEWVPKPFWVSFSLLVGVVAGTWWVSLGFALMWRYPAVHAIFWPFAEWVERRHGVRLVYVGILVMAVAITTLVIVTR